MQLAVFSTISYTRGINSSFFMIFSLLYCPHFRGVGSTLKIFFLQNGFLKWHFFQLYLFQTPVWCFIYINCIFVISWSWDGFLPSFFSLWRLIKISKSKFLSCSSNRSILESFWNTSRILCVVHKKSEYILNFPVLDL